MPRHVHWEAMVGLRRIRSATFRCQRFAASRCACTCASLILAAAVIGGSLPSSAAGASCPAIAYIGAAGSGELEHSAALYDYMGPEVEHMGSVLKAAVEAHGLPVQLMPDKYPAAPVSDLYPHSATVLGLAAWAVRSVKYFRSIDDGVHNAETIANNEMKRCPNTQLVLGGYSQGAMVMHLMELRLPANGDLMKHIVGTLLLGDGVRSPNSKAKLFGMPKSKESMADVEGGEGIGVYLKHWSARDVPLPGSTAEICSADDIVCDFKLSHVDTPNRAKAAAKVHTTYAVKDKDGKASSYSPLLEQAADWIADQIIAAHTPRPSPPPPPPTAPAPTVPAVGPTAVYTGETAGKPEDLSFIEFGEATGQGTQVSETLPASLYPYRCVVLDVNTSFSSEVTSQLASYLAAGGTIIALGEHAGARWSEADGALNGLAGTLGAAGITLDDDELDVDGDHITSAIQPSPLTAGVEDLGDNWVSSLTVSAPAQTLVDTAEDSEAPLVAYEPIGPGTFVMSGDSNMFSDNNDDFFIEDSNGVFARNLCP